MSSDKNDNDGPRSAGTNDPQSFNPKRISLRPLAPDMQADEAHPTHYSPESAPPPKISVRPPGSFSSSEIEQEYHTTPEITHDSRQPTHRPEGPEHQRGISIGKLLAGKYRLDECIGSGGMGEVYRAEHVSLRMPVAVKLLHRRIAVVSDYVRRFYREARAATLLNHPNVVRVLDFGQDDGLPYLVMEYLEGQTLHAWLRDRDTAPPLMDVRDIMSQILDAFEAAHARGIIHRDVKPENVFLTEVLGKRVAKILDFGLAHVEVPKEDDAGPTLTKPEAVGGTPEYMSPEQCHSLAVGPASDIYALGCVLTAMLQGRPPFSGRNSIDIISAHLFLPPPALMRPTGADPVPPLLDRLRQDMLSKQPEKRPPSAAIVRERLYAALDPASIDTQLVTRKGNEPLGTRASRVPEWEEKHATALDSTNPNHGLRDVGLLRLKGAAGVDFSCEAGLASQGIHLVEIAQLSELAEKRMSVLLVDAGGDIEGAGRTLGEITKLSLGVKVVVCASGLTPDRMTRLVSAGAADVVNAPAGADALAKKIGRILRRGR